MGFEIFELGTFFLKEKEQGGYTMKKSNFGQRGFTLVEMIFVLAIILTLVAIFLPLATSKLSDANTTRTKADEDAISAALTAFFTDLSIWPASDGSAQTNQTLAHLFVGDGGATITSSNPTTAGAGWHTGGTAPNKFDSGVAPASTSATIANALNHLAVNNPNADATESGATDYKSTGNKRWKGPYIAKLASDPYGNNYVINIGAITNRGNSLAAGEKGWILSAGPDGILNTGTNVSSTSGDDIGYIFCTNCQ